VIGDEMARGAEAPLASGWSRGVTASSDPCPLDLAVLRDWSHVRISPTFLLGDALEIYVRRADAEHRQHAPRGRA
jgi:hypothetical protein